MPGEAAGTAALSREEGGIHWGWALALSLHPVLGSTPGHPSAGRGARPLPAEPPVLTFQAEAQMARPRCPLPEKRTARNRRQAFTSPRTFGFFLARLQPGHSCGLPAACDPRRIQRAPKVSPVRAARSLTDVASAGLLADSSWPPACGAQGRGSWPQAG